MDDVWRIGGGEHRQQRIGEVVDAGWRVERVDEALDRASFTQFAVQEAHEGGLRVIQRAHADAREAAWRDQLPGHLGAQLRLAVDGRGGDRRALLIRAARAGKDVVRGDVEHRDVWPGAQDVHRRPDVGVVREPRRLLAGADVLVAGCVDDPARGDSARDLVEGAFVHELACEAGRAPAAKPDHRDLAAEPLGEALPHVSFGSGQQQRVTHRLDRPPARRCTSRCDALVQELMPTSSTQRRAPKCLFFRMISRCRRQVPTAARPCTRQRCRRGVTGAVRRPSSSQWRRSHG